VELATGPLPSRAPMAAPAEHRVDPWSEFLHRTLVSASRTEATEAAPVAQDGVLPQPGSASMCYAGVDAE
jgi:hypothetical protein